MTRREHDSMGSIEVPDERRWGAQTQRALEHFRISTERIPEERIRALAEVKRACARVNADLGRLPPEVSEALVAAADEVLAGRHGQEFPLSVWQTGSGTQTKMNMNEVLASLAAARLGGEEFALILPTTDREGAREVAERVRSRILDLRCRTDEGIEVTVSASCGGAILSGAVSNADQLLVAADDALYDAKARGRDRVSMGDTLVALPKLST